MFFLTKRINFFSKIPKNCEIFEKIKFLLMNHHGSKNMCSQMNFQKYDFEKKIEVFFIEIWSLKIFYQFDLLASNLNLFRPTKH